VGANKWEGEDEDEDVKVRGSKTFFVNYFLKCAVCNILYEMWSCQCICRSPRIGKVVLCSLIILIVGKQLSQS
jgi:hypothetical protein